MMLLHHMSVTSGSLSTTLDTYMNMMSMGIPCELAIKWSVSGSPIRKRKRLLGQERGLDTIEEVIRHTNTAIEANAGSMLPWRLVTESTSVTCGDAMTTMKYFADCIREGIDPSLKCGRLFVLDTWDIERMHWDGELDKALEMIDRCSDKAVFLCNPATGARLHGRDVVEYYHKISEDRLVHLRSLPSDENKVLVRHEGDACAETWDEVVTITNEDYHSPTYLKKAFGPGTYRYRRHGRKGKMPFMYENVGKMMFEYALTGRKAEYSPTGKGCDDGLTYYLRRIGIDDSRGFVLTQSSPMIEKMIFCPETDKLKDIICANTVST